MLLARIVNRIPTGARSAPAVGDSMATNTATEATRNEDSKAEAAAGRQQLIDALNEDLAREYQAVIAYVTYSQVLKGAEYMAIARELEVHAGQELAHALTVA